MRSAGFMRSHTMDSASSITASSRRMSSYVEISSYQLNIIDFWLTGWYDVNEFHTIPSVGVVVGIQHGRRCNAVVGGCIFYFLISA